MSVGNDKRLIIANAFTIAWIPQSYEFLMWHSLAYTKFPFINTRCNACNSEARPYSLENSWEMFEIPKNIHESSHSWWNQQRDNTGI